MLMTHIVAVTLLAVQIGIACSHLFFAVAALGGWLLFFPIFLREYQLRQVIVSFTPAPSWKEADSLAFFSTFLLSLLTVAEHLGRRELVADDVLHEATSSSQAMHGAWLLRLFMLKRVYSILATVVWVALFFADHKSNHGLIVFMRVSCVASCVVLCMLHVISCATSIMFLHKVGGHQLHKRQYFCYLNDHFFNCR